MPAPVRGGRDVEHVAGVEGHHMSTESSDFPNRLRAHVELQGASLTAEELSHVGECYPRCRGKDHWDVREYASVAGIGDRKSTRLNSSHLVISYAVFCLKKKKNS